MIMMMKMMTMMMVKMTADQQKIVVFRLSSEVLENGLLIKSLHQVPVLHYAMSDWPLCISGRSLAASGWSLTALDSGE